jgi:glycosyltransferase involved in cell wall biosynthesis
MQEKAKVLILIGAFLPGYRAGGPIPSIANIVARLDQDFEFLILTADRDIGDTRPYPGVKVDQWSSVYGAQVMYCSPKMQKSSAFLKVIRETKHDLLYLNSFFAARFSIVPLIGRRLGKLGKVPTLLAPRGEFSAGALALKSTRKRTFLRLARVLGLVDGVNWHASTAYEAQDIQTVLSIAGSHISVASDLTAPVLEVPPPHTPRLPGSPLRIVFLSRISPMKNLEFALEALGGVDVSINFSIVGPEEDRAYAARCRALVKKLPDRVRVNWVGAVLPSDVPKIIAAHDLFFLPTLGENYGHVIAEALGAGTPVLLSDRTPWRGLEQLRIGHDLPLDDLERFCDVLREVWHLPPYEAALQRKRAAEYARERQRDGDDVEANRMLFVRALAGS